MYHYVRFEVFTAVIIKIVVFWDVVLCKSWVNRRFGGTYHLRLQGIKIRKRGTSLQPPAQYLIFRIDNWCEHNIEFLFKLQSRFEIFTGCEEDAILE
jgi:hypothetical protein